MSDTAVEFEVNPNTTMRTFSYLQDKGIIFNKRGRGYFIANDGYAKTMALKSSLFRKSCPPFSETWSCWAFPFPI